MSTDALVPTTRRPIPLKGREDLSASLIDYKGVEYWVLKDPVGLQYHRLQAEQYRVLRLLNGERSLEEIRDELRRLFPTLRLTLTDVQNLIMDLHQKGLVYSNRPGQGVSLLKQQREKRWKKIGGTFKNLLYLRFPGWDPERVLQRLYPYARWMFHPWAVAVAVMLVLSSWVLLAVQFEAFRSRLPEFQQFFGWPNLVYMWFTLAVAKIIHEFGHGLTCKHFGGECHQMGLMLLVFTPCLYCDVSDSWMLRNKWARIAIGGAGMYIEIILSAIAVFVWWNTQPGLLNYLALNVFFVTTVTTVIFNANPLMRFDGYYMLADLMEIPNLRPKADKLVRDSFAWYCLGIETKPDPFMPEKGRGWFILFAIAAWLYRWFILFAITIFLYTFLKPYNLESIGICLAVAGVGSIFVGGGINLYKILTAPRIDPVSWPKILTSLTVLAGLVTAALMIPLPLHVESSLLVEPDDVHHVYTGTPGRLDELKVEPGQRVTEGQVLAVLSNPRKEDKYRDLQVQKKAQKHKIRVYQSLGRPGRKRLASERLESINSRLTELKEQLDDLTIRAPCAGTVVAAPARPEPELDETDRKLPRWHGTPLEIRNRGCFLEKQTHLCSIAPNERLEAILHVDQADRNDIRTGQTVELKLNHLPATTYEGKVDRIAERHSEFAPGTLSTRQGGELATTTDERGRERLTSPAYKAVVHMDQDSDLIRPGMRGQARFLVEERTTGGWIWRYIRRTFHFRL